MIALRLLEYPVRHLALNTEFLVVSRKNRSMARGLRDKVGLVQGLSPLDAAQLDDLLRNAESAIPEIEPPPASPLA